MPDDTMVIPFASTTQSSRNRLTRPEHAHRINDALRRKHAAIIEVGFYLIAARRELDHGDYEAMVREDLLISPGEARKFRLIAANRALANRSHVNALPHRYTTLYQLSRIAPERLEVLIEDGTVHSKLKRWEAEDLADNEVGESPYRPKKPRRVVQAETPIESEDEDQDIEAESDADPSDESDDSQADDSDERLAIDADDIGEAFEEVLAHNRRKIEHLRQHGDATTRGMVADQLREHADKILRLANELAQEGDA
jgi:hypothetical protein